MELLNSKDHAGVIDRENEPVFTKAELDTLLDRSDLTWAKISEKQKEAENGKKKQAADFGCTSSNDKECNGAADKIKENMIPAKHFKVIDVEGLPQGLQSVKED